MEDSKQQIKKYLPSKRFQIVLGAILVVIIGYLLIRFAIPSNTEDVFVSNTEENVAGEEEGPTVRDVFSVDTDGDGLYDWEENLWGTDPTVADSDGDGISDKEEVEQRKQESSGPVSAESVSQDELGRSLLSTYFALRSAGLSTQEAQAELETVLLEQAGEVGQLNEYTRDDFEVVENTDENISAYGQQLSSILNNAEIEASDVSVVATYRTEEEFNSEEAQAEFEQLETKYEQLTSDFLALSVPSDLAEAHLRVVNALNNLQFNYESLAQQDSDLEVLGSVVFSSTNWEELAQALYALQVYFVQRV